MMDDHTFYQSSSDAADDGSSRALLGQPDSVLARRSVADLVAVGRAAIEQAGSFSEVKEIRSRAKALHDYQRSIGAATDAINAAAEIRIRAERRMGEELAKADLATGGRPPETGNRVLPVS